MSLMACGGGMGGSGGGDDDKKRRGEPIDKPVLPLSDEDATTDTEEEIAGKSTAAGKKKKKRGLSKHYGGKSKSYVKLTDLGNTKSEEIVKKEHKVNKRRRKEIARKLLRKPLTIALAGSQSADQPMADAEEGELVSSDDDMKKKKKKKRKKSKSADQPMAEAAEEDDNNGKDDKMVDD